jgi:hypothetical protein
MGRRAGIAMVVALILTSSAIAAANGWAVVRSGSATGQFALKSINATVAHPLALGVRLSGGASNGNAVVSCTKGTSVAAWSRTYYRAGTFRLPMTRGADSCMVVAAVAGSGRVTVQILNYR